jgi:hypothetical protein
MKWKMKLTLVTVALASNYLLSWTYGKGKEETTERNDTVVVAASHRYEHMNAAKWIFLGRNYRKEWSEPVAMPVFHLHSTMGGFKIERLGGGQQTRSLHLISNDGSKWVLRSVDKFVTDEALPRQLRKGFIKAIVQDQISASYPYGLLTIHDLSKAVGVPSPTAQLYYVPDDTTFGEYRRYFSHLVCMLIPKEINGVDIPTEDTEPVENKLDSSSVYQVLQHKLLTARLLDMLIADWDRHKDQWEWGSIDSNSTVYYYPLPEDRDQAFFLSTGMLTNIIKLFGLPHFIGFNKKIKNLKKLNYKVHSFDRFFLNELDKKDWTRQIKLFQNNLTDAAIDRAVARLPKEIYAVSGEELRDKLIGRRDDLLKEGLKYYDYLADEVTIVSTEEPEVFDITSNVDSTVVSVKRQSDGKEVYERVFYPAETKTIDVVNLMARDKINNTGSTAINISLQRSSSN